MTQTIVRSLDIFGVAANDISMPYLLVGGFAASYWGKPRFTADVDFAIRDIDFERALAMMDSLGYRAAFVHPNRTFVHFECRDAARFRIDLMMLDSKTWEQLSTEAALVEFGSSTKHPVVGPLHLIAMKLHAAKQPDRDDAMKDLYDIVEVMLAQDISMENLEQQGILEKYGTEVTRCKLTALYAEKRRF